MTGAFFCLLIASQRRTCYGFFLLSRPLLGVGKHERGNLWERSHRVYPGGEGS